MNLLENFGTTSLETNKDNMEDQYTYSQILHGIKLAHCVSRVVLVNGQVKTYLIKKNHAHLAAQPKTIELLIATKAAKNMSLSFVIFLY